MKYLIIISLLTNFSFVSATEHSILLSWGQEQYEYFDRTASKFSPDNYALDYSYQFEQNWLISLGYAEQSAEELWHVSSGEFVDLVSRAGLDTESNQLSITWLQPSYSLTLSYGELENQEKALSRLPAIVENINSDIEALGFSFMSANSLGDWLIGYSIGAQYQEAQHRTTQVLIAEPPTQTSTLFDIQSWNVYTDIDLSYWIEQETFSWAPQFAIGWSWEVSQSGDPLVLVSRGEQTSVFNRASSRMLDSFKTPDAGYWELGISFEWNEAWNASFMIGETISSTPDILSMSFSIGFEF